MAKRVDDHSISPLTALTWELRRHLPGLFRVCVDAGQPVIKLQLLRRGEDDWLLILSREGDDGAPVVIFASGVDWVSALKAGDGQVQAGRWKADRPFKAGNGGA